MFLSGGLPAPDLQIAARTRNGMRYLDMGWRKYRVGFDYDGEDFHGLDHLVGDRRRHNDVLATDWKLFSLTAVDVFRTPGATVGQAAEALRKQGWKPASGRPFQATDIPRPAGPPSELLQLSRFRWSTANTQT